MKKYEAKGICKVTGKTKVMHVYGETTKEAMRQAKLYLFEPKIRPKKEK